MLALLRKLGIGFIYGVGFSLGVAGIFALTVFGGASYLTSTTGRTVSNRISLLSLTRALSRTGGAVSAYWERSTTLVKTHLAT
jgi:hypothetical protein